MYGKRSKSQGPCCVSIDFKLLAAAFPNAVVGTIRASKAGGDVAGWLLASASFLLS